MKLQKKWISKPKMSEALSDVGQLIVLIIDDARDSWKYYVKKKPSSVRRSKAEELADDGLMIVRPSGGDSSGLGEVEEPSGGDSSGLGEAEEPSGGDSSGLGEAEEPSE